MSTEVAGNGVDSVVNELSSSSPSPSKSKAGSIIDPDNSQSPHQLSNKTSDNNSSSSGPGTSAYSTPRSSSEKLDVSEATLRYQEQLVTQCKTRMKDKFDSLEKETGVKLRRYWSENINDSRSDLDHGTDEDDEDSSENESHVEQKKKSNPDRTSTSTVDTIVKPPTFESQVSDIPSLNEVKPIDSVTNDTIQLLRKQLEKVQDELKAKDDEITKLSRIRSQVEYELEDLTASLFEEANKMVRTANVNKAKFERDYKEAMMKMHVLQAEVDALKVLVITSTPATPNKHLHPHIEGPKNNLKGELMSWRSRLSPFNHLPRIITKSHSNQTTPKKSPSNYELGGTPGLNYESNGLTCDIETEAPGSSLMGEVDPVFHQQFAEWRKNPSIDKSSSFINNIYEQEVYPVLNFKNRSLTESVLSAIEDGSIAIESVSDKTAFPKKCALLDIPRTCKYRMKLGKDWYNISFLCRNRIAAICDLFCYLRYIQQGLVKSSFHDVYWEIMQRRKNIALSRLGLPTC